MNRYDRANLRFLMSASPEELQRWYRQQTQDDIDYAHALLEVAKAELIDRAVDKMETLEDANSILNNFVRPK